MTTLTPNRVYKDIDLNFTAHPVTKDVTKVLDVNAVKQSLKLLLFTHFNERKFQPEMGSPIYQLLFEPMDDITGEVLRQTIQRLIQNFEPRIRLGGVDVVPREEQNEYEITVYFTVVGLPTPAVFRTNLKRLR